MEQYINKADVMAEIDRRIQFFMKELRNSNSDIAIALYGLKSFLDTLEVKEVDLEKELDEWMKCGPHTNYPWCTIPDAIKITAEHFFELGIKIAQKEE